MHQAIMTILPSSRVDVHRDARPRADSKTPGPEVDSGPGGGDSFARGSDRSPSGSGSGAHVMQRWESFSCLSTTLTLVV